MNEVKKFIVDGEVISVPTLKESDFKTINGESIIGSGDIETGSDYSEGQNIDISDDTISAKGYIYDDSKDSFAIGSNSTASADGAIAEGNETVAAGDYSHVEGDWTLGIQTEYDCELNDLGHYGSKWKETACNIDPDEQISNSTSLMASCHPFMMNTEQRRYLLSITIEVPNFYESYLDFHDSILLYNNSRYKIIEYDIDSLKKENVLSNNASYTYTSHTSSEYGWIIKHSNPNYNSDFVYLTGVKLHREDNDAPDELNGVSHGKGKIILSKNGLVTGKASHSEGGCNIVIGTGSHAEGVNNKITGNYSHAEGMNNEISGDYSHAEGTNNIIHGIASHAQGVENVIYGDSATCMGTGLIAYENQTVIGRYNLPDSNGNYAFIIGNGNSNNARHNAFAVDWDGNAHNKF